MSIGKDFLVKLIIFLCVLFMQSVSALAITHSLHSINVKQNENGNYNIVLNVEGNANIKQKINSNDAVTLLLKSTLPSDSMEIIYDNTSDINNVIVQKKNFNDTIVVIDGKNISNSNVYTKNILTGLLLPIEKNSIFFGINNNIFGILAGVMFLFTMFYMNTRKKKITEIKISKPMQKTTPSISYNINNKGYTSIPKDFVINRYMESEKMRKVG